MLTHIEFESYRNLEQVAFDLTPLTVLFGPMATGKSTVLNGIHQAAGPAVHSCDLRSKGEENEERPVAVRVWQSDSPAAPLEYVWHEGGMAVRAHGEGLEAIAWGEHDRWVKKVRHAPLRIVPSRLAEPLPTYSDGMLAPDGMGFARAVAKAIEKDPFLLARLTTHLEPVLPEWLGPQIVHSGNCAELALFHARHGTVRQRELSEGLIQLLALTLLQYLPLAPITLLDDPEIGIDEHALPFLARSLAAIVRTKDKEPRQLVVATKSIRLIDELCAQGASVVHMSLDERGVQAASEGSESLPTRIDDLRRITPRVDP